MSLRTWSLRGELFGVVRNDVELPHETGYNRVAKQSYPACVAAYPNAMYDLILPWAVALTNGLNGNFTVYGKSELFGRSWNSEI